MTKKFEDYMELIRLSRKDKDENPEIDFGGESGEEEPQAPVGKFEGNFDIEMAKKYIRRALMGEQITLGNVDEYLTELIDVIISSSSKLEKLDKQQVIERLRRIIPEYKQESKESEEM